MTAFPDLVRALIQINRDPTASIHERNQARAAVIRAYDELEEKRQMLYDLTLHQAIEIERLKRQLAAGSTATTAEEEREWKRVVKRPAGR